MKNLTVVAALFTGALIACVAPVLDETEQESGVSFVLLLIANGINPLNYNGYGCYCGLGNAGDDKVPIDETDTCCQTHDRAYDKAPNGGRLGADGLACDCLKEPYQVAANVCGDAAGTCARHCCDADVAFAACIITARPTYHSTCLGVDRDTCTTTGGYECCGDADCEGGLWCNLGECVPYCGGGTRWKVATQTCEDIPTDVPVDTVEPADPAPLDPVEPVRVAEPIGLPGSN